MRKTSIKEWFSAKKKSRNGHWADTFYILVFAQTETKTHTITYEYGMSDYIKETEIAFSAIRHSFFFYCFLNYHIKIVD